MKRFALPALFAAVFSLSACGGSPERFAVTTPQVTQKVSIGFASVEVRDVSLPTYAASDEISTQDANGTLLSSKNILWADAPERAIALELSRNLAKMTSRRIASEPWPFESFPDARLDVRFAELVAGTDGKYRASGQYFVGVDDGHRERSGLFDLTVPYNLEGGPNAIAAARGQIIVDLAVYVARKGLR
jgi:uncharacterized lipoprotein YmbA